MTLDTEELLSEALIARYVDNDPRLVERVWLAQRIDRHLGDPNCRFILVCGGPGMGKTALIAWLARSLPVSPRYFIRADSRTRLNAGDSLSFLIAIGHQLAVLRPDAMRPERLSVEARQHVKEVAAGGRVVAIRIGEMVVSPFHETALLADQTAALVSGELVGVEISRLVSDLRLADIDQVAALALFGPALVLAAADPEALIVVLIDALDELRHRIGLRGQAETLADWLAACPQLPRNVRVVVTSRPDTILLERFRTAQQPSLREEAIVPTEEAVREDLRTYASRVTAQPAVASALQRLGIDLDGYSRHVADRAAGNFLYLVTWSRGVEQMILQRRDTDLDALLRLRTLPDGLDAIYLHFLTLIRDAALQRPAPDGIVPMGNAWDTVHLPLLAVLAVAQSPLNLKQLTLLTRMDSDSPDLPNALTDLEQFLEHDQYGYRFFHSSVAEFLTAKTTKEKHRHWYIDAAKSHRDTAVRYLTRYGDDWSGCADDYALTYTTLHLVATLRGTRDEHVRDGCANQLVRLVTDCVFNQRRLARLGAEPIVNDFLIVHDALSQHHAGHLGDVALGLAAAAVLSASGDQPALDAGTLHSLMVYRPDSQQLYERTLQAATDPAFVAAFVPDAEHQSRVLRAFLHIQGSRYRRLGDAQSMDRARHLLEDAVRDSPASPSPLDMQTDSALWYELAYLDYLVGNVDAAIEAFHRSAELADQGGDVTRYYISEMLAHWVIMHVGSGGRTELRSLTEQALSHFKNHADASQHARRWVMNAHAYLFELAYLDEDEEQAALQLERLEEDSWVRVFGPADVLDRYHARLSLLRRDWAGACRYYERILATELHDPESSTREGLAQDLMDYGCALSGVGHIQKARAIWERALRCSDIAANWPWKPVIAQLLEFDS